MIGSHEGRVSESIRVVTRGGVKMGPVNGTRVEDRGGERGSKA